ncbi:GtrA family protein [Glutamicibacter sp. NPDC087344]|uniref:GtrA family protein n=1 Tax=Glutamicibacter sp. NPDC087344 TaxID=3363994 RepID=UPI00382EADFA
MMVLIPAYQPDHKLVDLVISLARQLPEVQVVIVDDGSGGSYDNLFAATATHGAVVQRHPVNRGKGAALKSGFALIERHYPGQAVITADCDGQHQAADIARVAATTAQTGALTLGERQFTGRVPWRSKVGNRATSLFFALSTGSWLGDTQTGLRGFPAGLLPWLQRVPGERYEYELNMLLEARRLSIPFASQPIETIYLEGNESSHFRPVRDSLRIYAPLLKFAGSSLTGFAVDTVLLLVLSALFSALLPAVVLARVGSGAVNFWINRRLVFSSGREHSLKSSALRYLGLAVVLLAANYELLALLTGWGMPLLGAKLLTEATLFAGSYAVQKRWLFGARPRSAAPSQDSQVQLLRSTELSQPRDQQ